MYSTRYHSYSPLLFRQGGVCVKLEKAQKRTPEIDDCIGSVATVTLQSNQEQHLLLVNAGVPIDS